MHCKLETHCIDKQISVEEKMFSVKYWERGSRHFTLRGVARKHVAVMKGWLTRVSWCLKLNTKHGGEHTQGKIKLIVPEHAGKFHSG